MERLGFGTRRSRGRWPRLVYCSISGFGQTGPRRDQPGYDAVIQAEAGLMSITGEADGPPLRLGVAIADIVSGMFAAQGIAMALLARARTGRGQLRRHRHARLDGGAAHLSGRDLLRDRPRAGASWATGTRRSCPYETFAAADGDFVLAVGNDDLWRRFCEVAELPKLASDPRSSTNRDARRALRRAASRSWPSGCGRDRRPSGSPRSPREGVPCGAVRDVARSSQRPADRGARDDRGRRARDARRACACSASRSSCPTRPEPFAPLRRPSASTPIRFCAPTSALTDAEIARLRATAAV